MELLYSKNFDYEKIDKMNYYIHGIGEETLAIEVCAIAVCYSIKNKHYATFYITHHKFEQISEVSRNCFTMC